MAAGRRAGQAVLGDPLLVREPAQQGRELPALRDVSLAITAGEVVGVTGASGAVGLTLFALLGLESAAVPADAVDDPGRVVPIATMVGTGLSADIIPFLKDRAFDANAEPTSGGWDNRASRGVAQR